MFNPTSWAVKPPSADAVLSTHPTNKVYGRVWNNANKQSKENSSDGYYVGVNQFNPEASTSKKGDVVALNGVFLDFDMADWTAARTGATSEEVKAQLLARTPEDEPVHQAELAAHLQDVLANLEHALPGIEPSVVLCSGNGHHAYYWYKEAIKVDGEDETSEAHESYLQALHDRLNNSGSPAKVDETKKTTTDCGRRIGSRNTKNKNIEREVVCLHWNPDARIPGIDMPLVERFTAMEMQAEADKRLAKAEKRKAAAAKAKAEREANKHSANKGGGNKSEESEAPGANEPAPFRGDFLTLDIVQLFIDFGLYIGERTESGPGGEHSVICPYKNDLHPDSKDAAVIFEADEEAGVFASLACKRCDAMDFKGVAPATFLRHALTDVFGAKKAEKYCKPVALNRMRKTRDELLPSDSDTDLSDAFLAEIPYATDKGLVHSLGEFHAYNPKLGYWMELTESSVRCDVRRFNGAWCKKGHDNKKEVLISYQKTKDVSSMLIDMVKDGVIAQRIANPREGILFNNGFLSSDGSFTTDKQTIRSFGCTAPQRARCDWIPQEEAKSLAEEAPMFSAYLDRVLDPTFLTDEIKEKYTTDPRRDILLQAPGMALLGCGTKTKKLLILYGEKGTGKSTYVRIVRALFDRKAFCCIHPQRFSKPFALTPLIGARINFVDDMQKDDVRDTSIIKSSISGDMIPIDRKFKDPVDYDPIAGHIYASNYRLRSSVGDPAFAARILEIDFTVEIRHKAGDDADYAQKLLLTERDAVLRHCVYAALDRIKNHNYEFTDMPDAEQKEAELSKSNCPVENFLNECTPDENARTPRKALYHMMYNFCVENGFKNIPNSSQFDDLMTVQLKRREWTHLKKKASSIVYLLTSNYTPTLPQR